MGKVLQKVILLSHAAHCMGTFPWNWPKHSAYSVSTGDTDGISSYSADYACISSYISYIGLKAMMQISNVMYAPTLLFFKIIHMKGFIWEVLV